METFTVVIIAWGAFVGGGLIGYFWASQSYVKMHADSLNASLERMKETVEHCKSDWQKLANEQGFGDEYQSLQEERETS